MTDTLAAAALVNYVAKMTSSNGGIAGVIGGNHDFIRITRIWGIMYPTCRFNIDGFGEITINKVWAFPWANYLHYPFVL